MVTSSEKSANLTLNTNISPYYDNFWEDANTPFYVQILSKPGYAVQARELSQIQSRVIRWFQDFGDFILVEKSPMNGGDFSVDTTVKALKLESGSNANLFIDREITGGTSGAEFTVLAVAIETESGDLPTLVGTLDSGTFANGEIISTVSKSGFADYNATLANTAISSNSSIAQVAEGIFFLRGLPLAANAQTIILDKYDNSPSYRIGLSVDERFVNSNLDTKLLDNAQGTDNYAAPGADRYRIKLNLDTREIDTGNNITSNGYPYFYEYLRVVNGNITDEITSPIIDPNIKPELGARDLSFENNVLQLKILTEAETTNYTGANGEPTFDYENFFLYIWYNGTKYKIGDGADAATLDGELPSYYLNYSNFTGTPQNINVSVFNNDAGYVTDVGAVVKHDWIPATNFYPQDIAYGDSYTENPNIKHLNAFVGPGSNAGYNGLEYLPFVGAVLPVSTLTGQTKIMNTMIAPPSGINAADIDLTFYFIQRLNHSSTVNLTFDYLMWSINDLEDIYNCDFWNATTGVWNNKETVTLASSYDLTSSNGYYTFFKKTLTAKSVYRALGSGTYASNDPIFMVVGNFTGAFSPLMFLGVKLQYNDSV